MKKVISLFLVMALLTGMLAVSFNALSVSDVDDEGTPLITSYKDGLAAFEEEEGMEPGSLPTQRIYFQMPNGQTGPVATQDVNLHHPDEIDPETGEIITPGYDEIVIHEGEKAPSWYNENNVLNGQNYAGVYWWGGPAATDGAWVGYRMEIEDYEQGIYYVDVPYDPEDDSADKNVATIIFNNGVDGGTDNSKPIYYQAAQTIDTNCQGGWPGDYDSLPYGSPDQYSFDNCIYIIDPDQVSINAFSNKQTCGANWYVYYGNGCYGEEFSVGLNDNPDYPDGTDNWSDNMQDVCKNPDHFKNGVHVGYQPDTPDPTQAPTQAHVHTPGDPVHENEVAATYKTGGSYDSVVYCTECGEEISRETVNTDPVALDSSKLYFDTNGTGWEMGTKNKVAFHIFGGDIENGSAWGAKKSIGKATAGLNGVFEFDPVATYGYTFTPGVQYKIIFVRTDGANWTNQTYDLLFTVDCFGHVAFCDGTEYENPVDSSKKTLAAFWYNMDSSVVGPVKQISSIGNVVGTCLAEGTTDESLFNDFLTVVDDTTQTTKYQNAYHFVVEAGQKTEQQMIDDIGTGLSLSKQQVYDAFTAAGVETAWDPAESPLSGDVVIPTEPSTDAPTEAPTQAHVHTPGEPVQDTMAGYPATCTAKGLKVMVTYCTECGEEISREDVVLDEIPHTIKFKPGKKATETTEGWKSYFYCTECGKYFSDSQGTNEVTWDQIVIPKIVPEPTEAPTDAPTEAPTQAPTDPPEPIIEGVCGDLDGDGEVTILDVTILQRVLAGIKPSTATIEKLGDVDNSGSLDITDATLLQRWLLGLNQDLPIGKSVNAAPH